MEPLGDDIWYVRGPDFALPGGARMPLGSTVVRLPDRALLVYSPAAFDADAAAAIAAAGQVAHIVAPNLLHHVFLGDALARWPGATLHAPAGLAAKRPDLPAARLLGDRDPAWGEALDAVHIAGAPGIDETVLFHRPTGTVICADLVFHLTRPANLRSRILFALMGVGGGGPAQSRAWRFLARDRAQLRAAVDRVLEWPIARVAPCHGEPAAIAPAAFAGLMRRAYGGAVPLATR